MTYRSAVSCSTTELTALVPTYPGPLALNHSFCSQIKGAEMDACAGSSRSSGHLIRNANRFKRGAKQAYNSLFNSLRIIHLTHNTIWFNYIRQCRREESHENCVEGQAGGDACHKQEHVDEVFVEVFRAQDVQVPIATHFKHAAKVATLWLLLEVGHQVCLIVHVFLHHPIDPHLVPDCGVFLLCIELIFQVLALPVPCNLRLVQIASACGQWRDHLPVEHRFELLLFFLVVFLLDC